MPKDEEWNGGSSRKVEIEQSTRETMDTSNGRLHYEVTGGSRKGCYPSGLQQAVQNDTFCGNDRRNIGRRISEII